MKHTPGRCDECIFVRDMETKERYVVPCKFHASTPDLLEALEIALRNLDDRAETNRKWTNSDQKTYEKIEQAIAKAKGE